MLISRSYLSGVVPRRILSTFEIGVEIELDARVVLQHPEADRVLAADELFLRIDAHIEVVGEQVIVRAIAAVLAAQDIGARDRPRRLRALRRQRRRARNDSQGHPGAPAE